MHFTSLHLPSLHLGISRGVVGAGVVVGIVGVVLGEWSGSLAVVGISQGLISQSLLSCGRRLGSQFSSFVIFQFSNVHLTTRS